MDYSYSTILGSIIYANYGCGIETDSKRFPWVLSTDINYPWHLLDYRSHLFTNVGANKKQMAFIKKSVLI